MNLADYLKCNKISQAKFAAVVGTSQGAVSHWLTGRHTPSPQMARQIERLTGGVVKKETLCPEIFGDAA